MKRYDIKSDPRFQERVKALSSDKRMMVLKRSMPVTWPAATRQAFLKAIAPNGGYFIAICTLNDDGSGQFGPTHFIAHWIPVGAAVHDAIKVAVLSYLVLADEDEIEKVKEISMVPRAIEAIVEHKTKSYFEHLGPLLTAEVQGTLTPNIKNPYHREK